jgi:guanylate kinase
LSDIATAGGHLFIVSAPSGAGKTSLVKSLVARIGHLRLCVSHTTRARRDAEVDGIDYHFVSPERFDAMVGADEFLEHATVFDHSYGTSREGVEQLLREGHDVILEIDWQGARSVRKQIADCISIFVLPPSLQELSRRLQGRGDSAEIIARRMSGAVAEISHHGEFDYLVVNETFEVALDTLQAIMTAARHRLPAQQTRHAALLSELLAP